MPAIDKKGLTKAGEPIVDQMALVMLGHSEVTKWLVAVGSRSRPTPSGRRRDQGPPGRQGLAADRLDVLGAAGPAKIGGARPGARRGRRAAGVPGGQGGQAAAGGVGAAEEVPNLAAGDPTGASNAGAEIGIDK